jgi:hypothetical protein
MMTLQMAKAAFFDRQRVVSAVKKANRENLGKAGKMVRGAARELIGRVRKKAKPRPPGQPPRSPTGTLKRSILFAYDDQTESVVVGAVRYPGSKSQVPALMEYGGTARRRARRGRKQVVAKYPPRPYMRPANVAAAPKFPKLWHDSVV